MCDARYEVLFVFFFCIVVVAIDVDGVALNSFLDGTFYEAASSVNKNKWVMWLPSASATSSDIQDTHVKVSCSLPDYAAYVSAVEEDFYIAVHMITTTFNDQHVLVNG